MPKGRSKNNKSVEQKNLYSAVLTVGGKSYQVEAETIIECLEQLSPTPINGKAILKVTKGNMSSAITFYPILLRRLLVNKIYRQIVEKRLNNALKTNVIQ